MYRFSQGQSQPNEVRHYLVQFLCQTLEVSRSGYYQWLKPAPLPAPAGQDAPATERVKIDNQ